MELEIDVAVRFTSTVLNVNVKLVIRPLTLRTVLFFLVYSILCLHFSALPWFVISTTRIGILDTHLALH